MWVFDNAEMARKHWIDERLEKLPGKTKTGLAAAMGTAPARISDIIAGRRRVKSSEVSGAARYLEMDPIEVLQLAEGDATDVQLTKIPVVGTVQAGHWVDAFEDPRDEWTWLSLPPDPSYPDMPLFGLRVRGPSMNLVYPPGTVVVVAPILHLREEDLTPGKRVVVQRRRADGLVEATLKEIGVDDEGRTWLWPKSNHPEHQAPLRADDGEEVQIIGVVVGSYRRE